MTIQIPELILREIIRHGEKMYPEEGAGVLLGTIQDDVRMISSIYPIKNTFVEEKRNRRYLIDADALLETELEAEKQDLDLIGVFHSHPDHPAEPSEYDRNWALPWFSYIITSVQDGVGMTTRSWRLNENREHFHEEEINISPNPAIKEVA